MCATAEAVAKFDALLSDIARQNNPREHKRLKFVNCNLLEWELVEQKLQLVLSQQLGPQQKEQLAERLESAMGECRVVECLLALIAHAEEHIDQHEVLLKSVIEMMHEVATLPEDADLLREVVTKCSLMVYDAFGGLCTLKRTISSISLAYQVPYYYDLGEDAGAIRIRSSLLSTYKNLNTIIDDLSALSETLWIIRNYDLLGV